MNSPLSAPDRREAHRVRQSRKARTAYASLRGPRKKALERGGLQPVEECDVRFGYEWATKPLGEHEFHLASDSPIPGEDEPATLDYESRLSLSDRERYQIESDAVRQTLEVIIPALCTGFDRGPALAKAVQAVLDGQHIGETADSIAKAHGAPKSPLRKMLQGIRHLIDDPLAR